MLDPGSHEIRFERAGATPVVRTISLAMGDRDRVVRATFKADAPAATSDAKTVAPAPATKEPDRPRGGSSYVAPVVLGGIGAVSIGVAGAFWLMGNSDLDDARARCQNGCADTEADGAKQKHLIGDIALGVGLVSLAAAVYFLITHEKAPQPVVRF
jgi:hypothetical protein